MSVRRKINKIMKSKGIAYQASFDRSGCSINENGWWTIHIDNLHTKLIRKLTKDESFSGVIEFIELEDGLEELFNLPSLRVINETI